MAMGRRGTTLRSEVGFRHTPGFGAMSGVRGGPRRRRRGWLTVLLAIGGLAGLLLAGLGDHGRVWG
jgi:hypothetical protein